MIKIFSWRFVPVYHQTMVFHIIAETFLGLVREVKLKAQNKA